MNNIQNSTGKVLGAAPCSPAILKLIADMEAEALKQESYWGTNWERPCYGSGHAEGYAQATRRWMTAIKENAEALPTSGLGCWVEVNDTDPSSVPADFGNFIVATDTGLVTESFYVPDLKYFKGRTLPSRKWHGKYSRRFEAAQHGYKITHWMLKPSHPNDKGGGTDSR